MKKPTGYFLLFLIGTLLIITSCNKKEDDQPGQPIRVAMLAQGTTFDDLAFLQSCKTGLEKAKTNFGLECEYNIDTTTNKYEERLEYYGGLKFDLIIAVGYMWNDAVVAAAKKYPGSRFVLVDTELSEPQPNAMSILFDVDEVAYPLGFLSAWWANGHDSENPAVGFVGAFEVGSVRQFIEPFLNGVERFNQEYGKAVTHHGAYAGTFIDSGLGGKLADSLMELGADVMFGVGGQTGNGALLKAKERERQGIGVDVDQYISFPEVSDILLSSAMKSLDNAIYAVVKSLVNGNFNGGGIYTGNLANQGVKLAPYHDYEPQIPDSMKLAISRIEAGIIDGSISTGW
ncbi:MAG: BMP family ABC transporter substrate-binding protein [Bacteroidales bacterium]|jgi:basic membrane protein A|nr:BMP family ABC transporter substrate-binding protein [Bacteroidales bacterium]